MRKNNWASFRNVSKSTRTRNAVNTASVSNNFLQSSSNLLNNWFPFLHFQLELFSWKVGKNVSVCYHFIYLISFYFIRCTQRLACCCHRCIILVLLVVNSVLIWRLRRVAPNNRAATKDKTITDDVGQPDLPRDQHVSEPGSYMELHPRPSEGQSRAPPEYQTLQGRHMTSGYYNVALKEGNRAKQDEDVYAEIGND